MYPKRSIADYISKIVLLFKSTQRFKDMNMEQYKKSYCYRV